MDSTPIIITLITVGATLIVAVVGAAVGATWRVGRMTGGLQQSVDGLKQSVTDGARASSEAHASIGTAIAAVGQRAHDDIGAVGQRIDETRNELRADIGAVGQRVDRVLEGQAAQGGPGSGISVTSKALRRAFRRIAKESDTED